MTKADEGAGEARSATALLTFLIADVRGYTRFTDERGDEAAARLADRFADIVHEVVAARGGRVLELRGDEALVVFPSARQALHAAVGLQSRFGREASDSMPLHVGMGLDAGEAIPVRGGYRGGALNLAARLCSMAGPGEVFASATLVQLARKTEGLAFVDRGRVQLKGLKDAVHVFQIAHEGELPSELPQLHQLLLTHPGNLPDEPTPFVGREQELAAVSELLQQPKVRLVTLTGAGGTGKTRLALQAGGTLLYDFKDGVFFVSLAPIVDPGLVVSSIAGVLGIKESGDKPLVEALKEYLSHKHLLLVLDNFEHLLDARPILTELLEACRALNVLVTSRTLLHLAREHAFDVPPLSVPDPRVMAGGHRPDVAALSQYEAVALFLERAQAAKAGFSITNENAPTIAEICYRLDGLPLAIELAAARVRLFPPQALLARLSSSLQLLTGGAQDAPARQQTMRGTIDWSYSLLNRRDQELFARLAVFAGGCTWEAAEALCEAEDVFGGLESLVEKSLVRQAGEAEPRFSMLQTIREYGWERLAESGSAELLRRRHAEYYLALVEEAELDLRGEQQGRRLEQLETEHDNVRAALRWALEQGEIELGTRLAGSLFRFWLVRGHLSEGRRWLDELLAADGTIDAAVRAKALNGDGNLAWMQGEFERARALLEENLRLRRQLGDRMGMSQALSNLGSVAHQEGDYARAAPFYEESLVLARELGQKWNLAVILGNLGLTLLTQGAYERAAALCEESLGLLQELGDKHGIARVLNNLVVGALEQGNYERATALQLESLDLTTELGNPENIPVCLEGLAKVAAGRGQADRAARLWGAAESLREELGQPLSPDEHTSHDRYLAMARTRLEEGAFAAAWRAGRAMTPDQAIAYALTESASPVSLQAYRRTRR